jgi:predicted XRE-type DNA-binding protein
VNQAQVAERFGVAQSRVNDLLTGKTEKFSLDMLITLDSRIGCKVELAVE